MKFTKEQIKMQELRKAFKDEGIGFSIRLEKVYFECEICFDYDEQEDSYAILEKKEGVKNVLGGDYIFLKYCSLECCVKHITENPKYRID